MTDVETGGIRTNSSEEDPIDAVMWDDDIDLGILLDMDDGLHSSPALSIGEIEKILLNDDVQDGEPVAAGDGDDFFSGCFLLDSPLPSSSSNTTAVSSDNHASPDIASLQQPQPPSEAEEEAVKDSSEPSPSLSPEEEREGEEEEEDSDDPLTKKRKRQMRNRDAAVRSRERKKMYVKDLEAKSKYFESECRRLGMVLQCVMAENHSLRLAMYNNRAAFGASATRQESAVLFLESLLLGSLLWLVVGVTGLLLLEAAVGRPGKNLGLESRRRKAPSEALQLHWSECYMMSKGCRGSRRKMRAVILLRS